MPVLPSSARQRRLLDPDVIARLGSLELKARTVVEGFLSGLHRSPFKGFSVEFAEYRQYMPGDDLATIDWKVYARNDRYVVKKFEEETNLDCHLIIDLSASMSYGSGALTKLEYASCVAASLAYLMTRQRDSVGVIGFDDRIVSRLAASARPGHLRSVLISLDQMKPGRRTDVAKPLHELADSLSKRGVVVLISDLLDDPRAVVRGLKHFRHSGTDVLVFQVLDQDELEFPFEQTTRFEDLETGEEVMAAGGGAREHYLAQMRQLNEHYRRELGAAGIDYQLLSTRQPLDLALMSYLSARGKAL